MTIEQLTEFITVAKLKNFSKAAEALYITQSALSRHIAALEASLGVVLMVRNNRFVQLTPAGEVLLDEGQSIMDSINNLENKVISAASGVTGSLSVHSQPLYNDALFNAYRNFCDKYPHVVLRMRNLSFETVLQPIREGSADCVITFSFCLDENLSGFNVMSLYNASFCGVIAEQHPLAVSGDLSMEALRNVPLLYMSKTSFPIVDKLHAQAMAAAPPTSGILRTDMQEMFLRIKAGMGWAIVPQPVAAEYGSGCRHFSIDDPDSEFEVVLVWSSANKNPCLKLFREEIFKSFNSFI